MTKMSSCCHRRQFLQGATAAGLCLALPARATSGNIHELSGNVYVNRRRADQGTIIRPGDTVTTSHNGRVAFSVDGDAFLLKERTSIQIDDPGKSVVSLLHLLTGKLLSVFETGRRRAIVTRSATIGIRGTACFLNAEPDSLYYCNCYGKTTLNAGGHLEHFEATHHNAHQIDFHGSQMMGMQVMAVIDHTDDELRRLESLVGRVPAFDR